MAKKSAPKRAKKAPRKSAKAPAAKSAPARKAVARRTDLARARGTAVVPHSEDSEPLVGRRDRHSPPL